MSFFYFKCVFNAGNRNKFAEENIHLEMILTLRIEISAGNKLWTNPNLLHFELNP